MAHYKFSCVRTAARSGSGGVVQQNTGATFGSIQ
jgi:hypothetical protein